MIRWIRRLLCRHDFYFVRTLNILGEVRCHRCDGHWLYSAEARGAIPWPKGADAFFDAREAGR